MILREIKTVDDLIYNLQESKKESKKNMKEFAKTDKYKEAIAKLREKNNFQNGSL